MDEIFREIYKTKISISKIKEYIKKGYSKYFSIILPRVDIAPRIAKSNIATLYRSIISDFLPTYLTPIGTETITPAIYEKIKNQNRKTILSRPIKIEIYGTNGIDVKKQRVSADVFP